MHACSDRLRPGVLARALLLLGPIVLAVAPDASAQRNEREFRGRPVVEDAEVLRFPFDGQVKLVGIDAPDQGQICISGFGRHFDCHRAAMIFLEAVTKDREVNCRIVGREIGGLPLGQCFVANQDLAAGMVRAGWAWAYRSLGHDYTGQEARAQSARSGVWSGRAEAPWLYRSRRVGTDVPTAPGAGRR